MESKSFDDLLENYFNNYLDKIKKLSDNIVIYDVCLVKFTHHVKGKIIFEKKNKIDNFYFISYNCNKMEEIPKCNSNDKLRQEKNKKEKFLCLGAYFTCPEKDSFIKLKINIKDIRLLMRRIYYQRKTGIEIFTSNKSYYFNFAVYTQENDQLKKIKDEEKNCIEFLLFLTHFKQIDFLYLLITKL